MHKIQKVDFNGFDILIGKNAKANDHLTFEVANDIDIWMHVKGCPGSHVVIKVTEEYPDIETIKYAAIIAKYNSKAKHIKAVIVYCERKYVTKLVHMNDGQVMVDYKNSNEIEI